MAGKSVKSKSLKQSNTALVETQRRRADEPVPHLGMEQVRAIIEAVDRVSKPRFRERNKLLIRTLFDGCLRVSEAIQIKPGDLFQADGYWRVKVRGKGNKYSTVAISPSLATQLLAYAYDKGIDRDTRIFPVNPSRVFQIVQAAMDEAGVAKPGKVGSVHILRHSGALERLRETGNPRAVQDQLRHKSQLMTLRYLKTLSREESLAIQGRVDFRW